MKLYKINGLAFIDSGYSIEYVELLESEVEKLKAEVIGLSNRLKEWTNGQFYADEAGEPNG